MKIILPFEYPHLSYDPWTASTFGISITCENSLNWTFMNYVHFEIRNMNIDNSVIYPECNFYDVSPWVVCKAVPRNLISGKWKDFCEFCIDSISKGYYVYTSIDTYYIPEYVNYKREHIYHEILIYGFDLENEYLNIADFFNYTQGKYRLGQSKFHELQKAYDEMLINMEKTFWDNDVVLFQRNVDLKIECDAQMLKSNLIQYLSSCNLYGLTKMGDKIAFNFAIYDILIAYCESLISNPTKLMTKVFNMLLIHKDFMVKRIEYLSQNRILGECDGILNQYLYLVELCNKNQNLAYKYNLKHDNNVLQRIISNVSTVKSIDSTVTQKMIDMI